MVIDETCRLQERIDTNWSYKLEVSSLHVFSQCFRQWSLGGHLLVILYRIVNWCKVYKRPEIIIKTAKFCLYFQKSLGVGTCCIDFPTISDDGRILQF